MVSLKRTALSDRTIGILTLPNGDQLKTIEPPWLDNKVGKSCIPAGQYKFKRDRAGRHQWWKILDVEGRTNIEIHEGFKPSHSEGCILMSKYDLVRMLDFFDGDETYILEIA